MWRFPETLRSVAVGVALLTLAAVQTPAPAAPIVPAGAQPAASATPGAADRTDAAAGTGGDVPAAAPAGVGAKATGDPPAPAPQARAGGTIPLGRAALPQEIAAWDTDVRPDGLGLPPGSGDVATGEALFSDHCASCHGDFAEGVDNWPKLAGGVDTLDDDDPVKTVGSYWPHLSTAWDYVHRSMPFGAAQTLDADQTYAVIAYVLYSNDLVDEDFVLDQDSFRTIRLPNADGFVIDDRATTELPRFTAEPCMTDCKDRVEITRHATNLDVTPGDPADDADAVEGAPALD